jgi:hypothetical protein
VPVEVEVEQAPPVPPVAPVPDPEVTSTRRSQRHG